LKNIIIIDVVVNNYKQYPPFSNTGIYTWKSSGGYNV